MDPSTRTVEDNGNDNALSAPGISATRSMHDYTAKATSQPLPRNNFFTEEKDGRAPGLKLSGINDSSIKELLCDILETLQDSSIAGPTAAKDDRSRFWGKYKRVAEEHDSEFLERYTSDMDIVLIFAGLFSAVSTSFIVAMESSLLPDPSDTTNALLVQIAQMLGSSTTPGQAQPVTVPVFAGPSQMDIWVQTIAYLSLASSLLAALGAVLGKQWLGYYKASRYGRGSPEERGLRRQEKFEGLQTWYFDAILQSFPLLIQFSLFLFGLALSGHTWSEQRTIAGVIIATTAFGTLFYIFTLFASLLSPACPFQSPLSRIFRLVWPHIIQLYRKLYDAVLQPPKFYLSMPWRFMKAVLGTLNGLMHHLISYLSSPCHTGDEETGARHSSGEVADPITHLSLPYTSVKGMEASSVLWLLETSTDPEVLLAASRIVPDVEWHPDFDVSRGFIQISQMFLRSFGHDGSVISGEYDKAMAYGYALNYLHWEMDEKGVQIIEAIMNAVPSGDSVNFWDDIERFLRQLGAIDNPFLKISPKFPSSHNSVLQSDEDKLHMYVSTAQDQDMLRILHLLPYASFNFPDPSAMDWRYSAERALVMRVIPRILDRQYKLTFKSPGVSDCAMVLGRCLGLQFGFKAMRKLDKSKAFDELTNALYMKITAILQINPPDLANLMVERRIAMDCVPFVLSLFPLLSPDSYCTILTTDRHLSICKGCFHHVAAAELRDNWRNLPHLKTSIQQTLNTLNPDYCNVQTTSTDWKSSLWELDSRNTSKSASRHHPWLLQYLRYLCNTFSTEDISDLRCTLLLSIYSLDDLQKTSDEIQIYVKTITFCMGANHPDELRRAALRAIYGKRDIFRSTVIQSTPEWEKLFKEFSAALLGVIQNPHPEDENDDGRRLNEARNLVDCIYCYARLIVDLAGSDTTCVARFIQDDHLETSLITPPTRQLVEDWPSFALLCMPAAAQISFHIREDIWKSLVLDFWANLRWGWLGYIARDDGLWSGFRESLPRIIQLTMEHVDSVEGALLILPTISEVRENIRGWTQREKDLQRIDNLLNDIKLQEKLNAMIDYPQ